MHLPTHLGREHFSRRRGGGALISSLVSLWSLCCSRFSGSLSIFSMDRFPGSGNTDYIQVTGLCPTAYVHTKGIMGVVVFIDFNTD
ncbi:hypothetical protein FKM82_029696 [Ascaphus truei]